MQASMVPYMRLREVDVSRIVFIQTGRSMAGHTKIYVKKGTGQTGFTIRIAMSTACVGIHQGLSRVLQYSSSQTQIVSLPFFLLFRPTRSTKTNIKKKRLAANAILIQSENLCILSDKDLSCPFSPRAECVPDIAPGRSRSQYSLELHTAHDSR